MRRIALVVLVAVVLAGCKVHADVVVHVQPDGSGVVRTTVRADAEAVAALTAGGGTLESRVRLADLAAAGWTVSRWTKTKDGAASIVVSKPFNRPTELTATVGELSGTDGPLRGFEAARDTGLLSTSTRVRGRVDLGAAGTGVPHDAQLLATLAGQRIDAAVLDRVLAEQLRKGFSLTVRVELPGRTVTVKPRAGRSASIDVSASERHLGRVVLVVVGVVLGLLALVLLVAGELRRGRRRNGGRSRVPG
ncbi:MAG: hypothetical protein U0V73_01115 [Acidimicrobiia bacterium]